MSMEMICRARCDWCGDTVELPARKVPFLKRWKQAKYPDNWNMVKGAMVCDECNKECDKAIDAVALKRQNAKKTKA